jgi:U3 small nucleolar RNA-associated protein 22
MTEVAVHFKENRSKLPPVFIVTPFDMNRTTSVWTTDKPNMQQLCRIVILARQSLQALKKSILNFESSESFKNIFRPNCEIFDVVINLKAPYCVKAFQKVDIAKGTFLPHYHNHTPSEKSKEFPVVDFDPVQIYLKELRSAYGELAYFCSDLYGDTKVYVLWRPDALKSKELSTQNMKFRLIDPMKNLLELNLTAIIDDFKILGDELVESVDVKNESLIFK